MEQKQIKARGGTVRRLLQELLQQKGRLLLVVASVLLATIFNILAPSVLGDIINQIVAGFTEASRSGGAFSMSWTAFGTSFAVLGLLYGGNAFFTFVLQYVMASVSQSLTLSLRKQVSAKLDRLPIGYFDGHERGDILSRVSSDLEKVADTMQEGLPNLLSAIVGILGALGMMVFISPLLTLIAVATIILSIVLATVISSRTQKAQLRNQTALGDLNGAIEEIFTGNTVVKAFNLENQMVDKVADLNQELYEAGRKAQFVTFAINPLIRFINQLGYVLVAIQGGVAVINGSITIGQIQAFFQYITQVSEPITQVSYIMNALQGAIASAGRVYELLDEQEEVQNDQVLSADFAAKGQVEFDHVRFGYSPDKLLMKDIDLHIKPGSKVAIVGPTGAGKTTMINLLMRFYELNGGQIKVDGVNIAEMKRSDLRSMIGMVLQDTWLFSGSVRDNLAYGRPDAALEQVQEAAKLARVDHIIRTMPQGYDTLVDSDSSSISQGEKQLLTIARAILADPKILILDEATSSVDTRTEQEIQKAMNQLMEGRTSFIIAHRLSTIRDADVILVMKNGNIIEQGSHEELMAQDSFYATLYNSQFAEAS